MNGKNLLLLITLAALWGPSFLFIKVAVEDIPPLTLVLGRVAIGATFLLIVLRAQRGRLPHDRRIWGHLAVVALLHNALPWVLLSWGEQYIDSALASILNGTTPLFTIILAHFLVAGDRMTASKLTGVLIGFAGLLLLVLPSLKGGLQATTWGLIAVTVAAALYGVAIIYSRNHLRGLPPLTAPASQLLLATLYMAPIAVLIDKPWALHRPSPVALGSLFLLGVMGTGLAFIVYYRLLETAGPTYISMVTYVIPIFGVVLGVLILNEQLTWYALGGFILILLGVMVVNGLFANHLPMLPRRSS
ncbi:MAG: DMT family transporter [Candidatus Promineofilum sp.]|nr:DMT family transporter [Promineifilum sp.]